MTAAPISGKRCSKPESFVGTHHSGLDDLIQELGLDTISECTSTTRLTLRRCHWPAANNGVEDRTVTIELWPDGRWWISLDVQAAPTSPPGLIASALRRMAAA